MIDGSIKIEELDQKQEVPLALLELADPSKEQIENYLNQGQCFVAKLNSQIIGVMVLMELSPTSIEIKNIAIDESFQGKGCGRLLLKYAEELNRKTNYEKLIIGTGNSSMGQLSLYQKEGFEISYIQKNFFLDNYDEPIFENGIRCKHRIVLEKKLK